MIKPNKWLKAAGAGLGLMSMALVAVNFFIFSQLRPKMVNFESLPLSEERLMNWVGAALASLLVFYLLSLLRLAAYLKKAKKMTLLLILLLVSGVLSLLFVFSDVALLSDIGKQYRHGLSQPEWRLLYPIMAFQFLTAAIFTYCHFFGFRKKNQVKQIIRDSNIFVMVQYVGVVCGLVGLVLAGMGFLFPGAWNVDIHVTASSIIILLPYILATGYWLITKFQEKQRQWYDEKQFQDVGKSAFITLIASVVFMVGLFVVNYHHLTGVVSAAWLPLYLFFVLVLFSAVNLYFSARD